MLETIYKIDDYLTLMDFILKNCKEYVKQEVKLVPIGEILKQLDKVSNSKYSRKHLEKLLIQLQLTHRIELKTTKKQLAKNLGIELFNIRGVNYGFIKVLDN